MKRRRLLKSGLALGTLTPLAGASAAMEIARPPWMNKPGTGFSNYGQPSEYEKAVIRWISANPAVTGNGVAWCPLHALAGMVTPNGLHFERHHHGVPQIDPVQHRLMVDGQVTRALSFSMEDLRRYPMRSHLGFIECGGNSSAGWHREPVQTSVSYIHGLVSCSEWCGVPLRVLLQEAGAAPDAGWVIAEGADAFAMQVSLPMDKAMDDTLVALYQNGEAVRPENGYPLRLVVPGWEGVLHVKWLRRLHVASEPAMARNETARYSDLMPSGKARQFSFTMDAKSVITSPHSAAPLPGPGHWQISGLAWSGRGRITRVDVSVDGGRSWSAAALTDPVLAKCLTRFQYGWVWDGKPTILQSRAVDESGYVQPTRETLLSARGHNAEFHYNAIVSWAIDADGAIEHVYA